MADEPVVLTDEQLRAVDAEYAPFPAFTEWPRSLPRSDLWEGAGHDLDLVREQVPAEEVDRAVDFVVRAAALDTGAIEGLYVVDRGFTITVAGQDDRWEAELEERGVLARELFEAQLRAYKLVMDVATGTLPIVTEAWIRRLHEVLTEPQETYTVQTSVGPQEQPLPHGEYKRFPNHVKLPDGSFHAYAPVDRTPDEMHRFVEAANSEEFVSAHPALQAAFSHHALTAIHPFADGNGRVARALASVFLFRDARIPLLVFADRKDAYLDALHAADLGDAMPFVRFVFDASVGAMNFVVETARTAQSPPPEDAFAALGGLMTAKGGLTYEQLDEVAVHLFGAMSTAVDEALHSMPMPDGIIATKRVDPATPPEPEGFRRVVRGRGHPYLVLSFAAPPPTQGDAVGVAHVLVSRSRDESDAFMVERPDVGEQMRFSLGDVHPVVTAAAQKRLEAMARRMLSHLAQHLVASAEESLSKSGYP